MYKSFLLATLVAAALATTQSASALTISVGPTGCTQTDLQTAINVLAASPDPGHTIKLRTGTISIPNGVSMNLAASDIDFIGGFASCANASPTPGQRSILDATGGSDGTVVTIDAGNRQLQQWITFNAVTIRGGSSETGPFANPEGGGLEIRGHARVRLDNDSRVQDNVSGKGAGAYLNGVNAGRQAELFIRDGSSISANVASTLGGGVYCNDFGTVQFIEGQLSYNDANDGGAAYLNQGCRFVATATGTSGQRLIDNNRALRVGTTGGLGGAIFLQANGASANPLRLSGDNGNPILLINNSAFVGGGVYASNRTTSRVTVDFINTVWFGQRATTGAAIFLVEAIDATIEAVPGCSYSFFGAPGCSAFDDNDATFGDGAIGTGATSSSAPATAVVIRRTRFENNEGAPAVIGMSLGVGHTLSMEGVIVRNNRALTSSFLPFSRTVFGLDGQSPQSIRYSTILGNDTNYIVTSNVSSGPGGVLNMQGNIVWAPGTEVWRNWNSGPTTFVFSDCLITHSSVGLPAGAIVADPQLQADFTPGPTSPALDVCDTIGGMPGPDYYGATRGFNQILVPNIFGPYDLGAVERTVQTVDALFSNGFEAP